MLFPILPLSVGALGMVVAPGYLAEKDGWNPGPATFSMTLGKPLGASSWASSGEWGY